MTYNAFAIIGLACLTAAGGMVHPALGVATAGACFVAVAIGGARLTAGKDKDSE